MSCEAKSSVFKKQIHHYNVFKLNVLCTMYFMYYVLKYKSITQNNTSSSEKVFWSESGETSAAFTKQLETNMWMDFDVRDNSKSKMYLYSTFHRHKVLYNKQLKSKEVKVTAVQIPPNIKNNCFQTILLVKRLSEQICLSVF